MQRPLVVVTGAAGFVGAHVVRAFAEAGYPVRATVRDPTDDAKTAPIRSLPGVQVVAGDLTAPGSFSAAMAGAEIVVHAASAVRLHAKDPKREIVDVAVGGTLEVLRAARAAGGVRRVVLTSSIAAVVDVERGQDHRFSELDFNESATLRQDPYALSKVRAERAARRFVDELPAGERFELVALLPTYVLGPVLSKVHLRTSPSLVRNLLRRELPLCPNLGMGIVDVRDVALAHVRAAERERVPDRVILTAGSMMVPEIAEILARRYPERRIPTAVMPGPAVVALSLVHPALGYSFVRRNLNRRRAIGNERMRTELGIVPRAPEAAIVDTAESIVAAGWA